MSEVVTIVETSPIKKCRYCLVSVPDVGLVGSIALGYIIQNLQMTEIGYLEAEKFPPVIVIHQGDPKPPLMVFSKGDIVVLASEIPITPDLTPHIARSITDWVKSKGVEMLISISGIAVQNRLEIEKPLVYGIGSSSSVKNRIKNADIEIFEEGFITGLHAVIMKECLKKNVPNLILLAQSHLQYPDPGAAASIIASLDKLVSVKVNTKKLLEQEDLIRLKMRELMQRTQQQMRQTQKSQEQEIPLMYS